MNGSMDKMSYLAKKQAPGIPLFVKIQDQQPCQAKFYMMKVLIP
jgi:hypothetical protein